MNELSWLGYHRRGVMDRLSWTRCRRHASSSNLTSYFVDCCTNGLCDQVFLSYSILDEPSGWATMDGASVDYLPKTRRPAQDKTSWRYRHEWASRTNRHEWTCMTSSRCLLGPKSAVASAQSAVVSRMWVLGNAKSNTSWRAPILVLSESKGVLRLPPLTNQLWERISKGVSNKPTIKG